MNQNFSINKVKRKRVVRQELAQKLSELIEIKKVDENWFIFCKKDGKNILCWSFNVSEEEVNQALKNCHEE